VSTPVHIKDGQGSGHLASVSSTGALLVTPPAFEEVSYADMTSANTAYEMFAPIYGKQFVMTGIIVTAKKNVAQDEIVEVYEADSGDSTTVTKAILTLEMLASSSRDITGLNLLISAGSFLNVKADDNDTAVSIVGYYVDSAGLND